MRKIFLVFVLAVMMVFGFMNGVNLPIVSETFPDEVVEQRPPVPVPDPRPKKEKSFYYWHTVKNRVCSEDELRNKNIPCEVKPGNPPEQSNL